MQKEMNKMNLKKTTTTTTSKMNYIKKSRFIFGKNIQIKKKNIKISSS